MGIFACIGTKAVHREFREQGTKHHRAAASRIARADFLQRGLLSLQVVCAPFMGKARWVIGWAMVGRAEFACGTWHARWP